MERLIPDKMRRDLREVFAALAAENPYITAEDREQCDILALVEGVVRGELSRGVPFYVEGDALAQECLVRIPEAIRSFSRRNGCSLKSYLKCVILHDVQDVIKSERREPIHSHRDGPDVSESIDPVTETEPGDSDMVKAFFENSDSQAQHFGLSRIEGAMLCFLTKGQYDAVRLCHLDGLTQEQAAKALGITREAVKSRLGKASATLQKVLNRRPR
jgi:RNA polymerase sigma factor (sigma-70 family)